MLLEMLRGQSTKQNKHPYLLALRVDEASDSILNALAGELSLARECQGICCEYHPI